MICGKRMFASAGKNSKNRCYFPKMAPYGCTVCFQNYYGVCFCTYEVVKDKKLACTVCIQGYCEETKLLV